MADLTHLDATSLTQFADNEVQTVIDELKKIRLDTADTPPVQSLYTISSTLSSAPNKQLTLGPMGATATVHGDELKTNLVALATAIDKVYVKHRELFGDMDTNLRDTVRTLLNTSGASLDSINSEKFISAMADVGQDLGGSTT
ncbi:type VII secretion system-associated protein [Streptomyces sp. NPDC005811]|uniref:type VII secretion system-associated protein n=1 Tax=Streptomyces sp. NPDC005811 TaxID=3154565 RepID=UPI0033EFFD1F